MSDTANPQAQESAGIPTYAVSFEHANMADARFEKMAADEGYRCFGVLAVKLLSHPFLQDIRDWEEVLVISGAWQAAQSHHFLRSRHDLCSERPLLAQLSVVPFSSIDDEDTVVEYYCTMRMAGLDKAAVVGGLGDLLSCFKLVPEAVPKKPNPRRVKFSFWAMTVMGPKRYQRILDVPIFSEVEQNYAARCRGDLRDLLATKEKDLVEQTGRLIVLSGPPGTGKTSYLRALGQAWREWCTPEVVIDPEQFFGDSSYMIESLMLNEDEPTSRWRLVVVEDAEELLVPSAKKEVGQAVARLLNLGDGLLGQGSRILVALTTNAPISKFSEAIVRPGRCLANIEIPEMTRGEARDWFVAQGSAIVPTKDMTLAACYEALSKGAEKPEKMLAGKGHGQYL